MKLRVCALLLVAVIWEGAPDAEASLRCNRGMVSVGDSVQDVEEKCGAPDHTRITRIGNDSSTNPRFRSTLIVMWYYGPRNGAVTQVRFSSDKVANTRVYRPDGSSVDEVYPLNP